MKSTNKLRSNLAKYAAVTAIAIGTTSITEAAIVYTDMTPDFSGTTGSQVNIDMNNDGLADFFIFHDVMANYLHTFSTTVGNEILGSSISSTTAHPYALAVNSPINSSGSSWNTQGPINFGEQILNGNNGTTGSFSNVTDVYLGVRFQMAGNTHYGWIRLDVNADATAWTVKDYAYEDVAGMGIAAGAIPNTTPAIPATNIVSSDISNNGDASDLQINYSGSADETTLSEYRLMVVKSANAASFNLTAAESVIAANYFLINPNGNPTYSQVMPYWALDVDGDPIATAQPYRVFILNMADGSNATINVLAQASMDVTLLTQVNAVTGVVGSDVANNMNGSDAQVNFNAALMEGDISEYRIMILKDVNAAAFTLTDAQAVPMANYTSVMPTGASTYSQVLAATATDVDGDAISNNVGYIAFVMSVTNGVATNGDNLSSGSPTFNLQHQNGIGENALSDIEAFVYGEELNIQLGASHASQLKVHLLTTDGKMVSEFTVNPGNNNISLNSISKGVYILRVMDTTGKIFTQKFVR